MLELLYTSRKIVPNPIGISPYGLGTVFMANWDAMLLCYGIPGVPGDLHRIFKDGTLKTIGTRSCGVTYGSLSGGGGIGLLTDAMTYGDVYKLDAITGQPDWNAKLNQVNLLGKISTGCYVDATAKMLLYPAVAGRRVQKYSLVDGADLGSVTIDEGGIYNSYHYAGDGRIAAVGPNEGRVVILDYRSDRIILQSLVSPCRAIVYDSNHNVYMTIEYDGKVKVYSCNPLPANLSAPVFTPIIAHRYQGNVLQTRVTGNNGEAVPDVWVKWRLVNGKGDIEKPFSKTDADGYAANFYFGPASALLLGTETVIVELVI